MAAGPERDNVNDPFRKGMLAEFPRIHWQRIENVVGTGVPDINLCLNGKDHWVESKWNPSKRYGKRFSHPLTAQQCAWLLKRTSCGGSAWILARRMDTFKLWHGSYAREVLDNGWNGEGAAITMDKAQWDWGLVGQVLEFPIGFDIKGGPK